MRSGAGLKGHFQGTGGRLQYMFSSPPESHQPHQAEITAIEGQRAQVAISKINL
jgi:hypothetical protein